MNVIGVGWQALFASTMKIRLFFTAGNVVYRFHVFASSSLDMPIDVMKMNYEIGRASCRERV